MSSNGIVGLNYLSNDFDLGNKKIVDINYDNIFKEKLIKVLDEILERLNSIEVTIEKNDLKK